MDAEETIKTLQRELDSQKDRLRELLRRREYLEAILKAAPDAIVTLDRNHLMIDWNSGAEKLFGYTEEEARGKNIMGNALEEDLVELWSSSSVIRKVRERYTVPLTSVPECDECPWVKYCNGGCPGIVQEMEGKLMTVSRRGCYRDFLKANGIESIHDVLE